MSGLTINAVLNSIENERLSRILWISSNQEIVYLYDLEADVMPFLIRYKELLSEITEGRITILDSDPYLVAIPEEELSDKEREIRDNIWSLVSDIVLDEPSIYETDIRGKIIACAAKKTGKTRYTLYRYLKTYWRGAKTKNAFLPKYKNSGGRGKERVSGEVKRGRPRKYGENNGKNVDEAMKRIFEQTIKKHYHDRREYALTDVYSLMIKEHYTRFEPQSDGKTKAVLLPDSELPTLAQFRYWYSKKYNAKDKLTKRKGEAKFALNHRALIGKSDYGVMGPGAKYQIDATVGDIYLVSRFNRAEIIGRPVLYFIVDVFSRMVVGMYVGLEGPSWAGAMMALANAAADKVKFCKEYGISITAEEWPCHYMPNAILADRGEMESKSVETLINALNVRVENAPPYRADMKGIIERYFRTINDTTIAFLPGHVKGSISERGGEDYRLDSKMDIYQLTEILIRCVLHHNNEHFLETYERTTDMIADNVMPIPRDLWNWGIANVSGALYLRSFPEETVKLCLMPIATATVTAKGIRFKSIFYLCERALKERWFETARAKGSYKVDISYDPRNMSVIYVRLDDGIYDKCFLAEWQDKYVDMRLEEIEYLHEMEKLSKRQHAPKELASKVDLLTAIDNIIEEAEMMARQTVVPKSKNARTKGISDNRRKEKELNRHDEAFLLGDDNLMPEVQAFDQKPNETADEPINPTLAMLLEQLEERLDEK